MNSVLQALADPSRRALVEQLRQGDQTVTQLCATVPIAQSGVSRHLRILRDAGVVQSRADGQRRIYSLCPEPFEELSLWLARVRSLWEDRLDQFEQQLASIEASQPPEESDG